MGVPLTLISPTLRHRSTNSICRSVARNYRFWQQGNEIVGKVGAREGKRNATVDKIGVTVSLWPAAFFAFSAKFFFNLLVKKKSPQKKPFHRTPYLMETRRWSLPLAWFPFTQSMLESHHHQTFSWAVQTYRPVSTSWTQCPCMAATSDNYPTHM